MKKIKKIIAASAMLAGSMVGITGCGEVYINFDSQTAGKEIEAFEYNQNSFQNDIQDVASSLTKNGYRVEGIYLDKDFTKPVSSLSEIKEDITLYVKWVAADIEVAFDVNGGSGEVASQYITYMTESMINSATIPTKDGYTFAGWTENADGSGKLYKNGESSFEMTGYNKVTLYAKWVANQYTITYDKNAVDATGVVANSNAQFGTEFEITNAEYTRNKYTFLGWNTKADGSGVSYSEGDKIDATENITLYAMWERNTFAINFDANSGLGNNMTALELMVGSNASLTTNTYTKPGYDFIGWSTNKNASVAEYGDGSSFTLNIKNDITLYAIWQVQTYKIVYDKNAQDATGATIPMGQVNYGGTTELTSLSYTRPEYDFVGWSTNLNATEAEFEAGDTISANDVLDTKTITLYAVWERNTFDIIFNSNSGNGEMDNVSIKYGTTTTLPNNVFTKSGYDFAGWAVDEESESVFDNESEYTLNVKNNITLYATWQPQTYTIVYHSNAQDAQGEVENDTILFDSSAALSNNEYTRAEYDFVGWSLEPNAVQADFEAGDLFELNSVNATKTIDLYAVWKRNTFVVSFDANGGEGTTREQKFKVNTPSNIELNNYRFTKAGYKFAGWNTNSNGSGDYYTDGSSFTLLQENDELTLYAVWEVKNYTGIIFNSNPPSAGLSVSGIVNEVDLEAGQTYTFTDSKYSLEEYDFLGWSTDPDATTADSAYNAGQEFTMPAGGDFTLYAVWERNTFVITLLANNGTSEETTQKIKYNDTENLLDNAFTNYGHVFIGWGTNNDGPTDNLIGDGQEYTLTEKADVILYARWEYGKYSVNYATNDETETGEVAAQENVTFNSTFKLSEAVFEKTDYKQVGWTDGKGNNYSIGQEITLEEEGLTLYPVWKLNNIEISFDLLGGSGFVESQKIELNETDTLNTYTGTKYGYNFLGWSLDSEATAAEYQNGQDFVMTFEENITLYAVWEAVDCVIYFNANAEDSEGIINNGTCKYDQYYTIPDTKYIRVGYTMLGWATSAQATTPEYNSGDIIEPSLDGVTLYAVWATSQVPYDVNSMANIYTNYDLNYDYTIVKGLNYTFDGVTLETILNASTDEVAEISGNELVANNTGTFTLRLYRTSNPYDVWEFTVLVVENNYTIIYTEENMTITEQNPNKEIILNEYADWAGGNNPDMFAYEFGVNKELDFISRIGYTFHGWTLVEDAFIGGKWIKAGTKLTTFDNMNPNTIIPCGSIGNIKLRASVKIDQYELSFHAYDFTNSEYVLISAINGYYNAHWTASLNYSEDRLINDLIASAPNGYMFAGWYSSTTQFNEDTRFDGYFNNHYSNLYARYIELPAIDPESISVTTSNIITWDKIEDISDADDVTYIVTVKMLDGGVEKVVSTIETQENKIDAALLITLENTDYIIEVAAKITFADDRSKFTNSATTEISTLNYTTSEIEVMSYSSMLEVFEGETSETLAISKRIVFTGMTYTFNFTDQNKVITIEDVSEEGLVQIGELNDNGEFVEVLDGNYTLRGGKYSVVMIIAKDKVGTFVMRQGSATRNVEVVPNIIGTSHGSSYANHLAIASNYKTEGFLDENHESVSEEYQVGALNEFQFDLKLDGDKYNLFKFNDAESKYSRAIIYLLDEQGNIVVDELGTPYDLFCDNETEYANALHYNPSTKEFTTTIDGTTIPCGVTRTENGFKFNEELGSYGIRYRVNLYVAFTRTNTGLEDTNSNKVREVNYIDGVLDVSKLSAPVVYDITLNNGVNVYNSAQLKAAYGDVSKEIEVMIINIHRDIVATLDEEQMQDDGSPINVLSQYVYDNDTNDTNSSDSNIRKTDGNIFKRASSKVNDKVVVNGNYCTIDATDVVLIPTDNYTDSVEADGNGTNHQVGFQKSTSGSGKYVRGQTGIFRYQCPNNGTAVFNNLNIVGNRPDNNLSDADKMDPEKVIDFERLQSGSLIGIYNENSRVIINNSKISKTYYAVKNDSAFGVGQNAYMELNYTKISDTYSDGYYGWNGKELRVFNSYMTDLGGMPFHMQDASAINPIFIIDENTVVDNLLSGTEGWFVTWGKAGLAASLKSTLQTALQTWGASVLTGDSGNFVNPIFVYNPTDMVNGDGNETKYGAYVTTGGSKIMCPANLIKKDESTNKYYYELNGEKLIAGYVYDENNNILNGYYIKNSVTSFKNIEYIAANPDADARVQQGMYVFTRNDAVSAQEFNALQAQLMTLFSTLTTAPADITNVPIVKYAAGIKAYEAACKLYQTYGLTPVSRDVFEAISLYIYNCIQASSTPSVEGACQLLLDNNLIVAADQEMQTKVGVLLLNAETTLATIDEQFVKSGFANIKLVEAALASLNTSVTNTPIKTIMLNAIKEYCTANNVTANDSLLESTINNLIAIDPEELEEYLSGGSDLEQCIAQLILEETTMSTLNSELSNYYTNTYRAVGGLKVTDYASIATEVVAVEFVRNNPEATISDRNANNLVNLTLYLAQTEHEGTTLLNQLVAKYGDVNTGTYILYSLGHEINEEDMIIELVIPSNNGTTSYMCPMLLLCTTGMSYPDSKWYSQS